jgi:hypothetical protein
MLSLKACPILKHDHCPQSSGIPIIIKRNVRR